MEPVGHEAESAGIKPRCRRVSIASWRSCTFGSAHARQFWLMAAAGVEDFLFCVDKPLPQRYVFSKT
jgi:hypothetical protein